jgi:hypothetical protein
MPAVELFEKTKPGALAVPVVIVATPCGSKSPVCTLVSDGIYLSTLLSIYI